MFSLIQRSRRSRRCLHIGMWTWRKHTWWLQYFVAWNLLRRDEMVCFSIHNQVTVQPKNNAAQELLSASARRSSSCSWLQVAWALVLETCLLSKAFRRPGRKNYISGYIWYKSFIQTVKCSFFNQIIVYQSLYGALLTLSYFLLKEKFCV